MKTVLYVGILSISLSGCLTTQVLTYKPDPLSGQGKSHVGAVYSYSRSNADSTSGIETIQALLPKDKALKATLKIECLSTAAQQEPLVAPIFGAGAGALAIGAVVAPFVELGVNAAFGVVKTKAQGIAKANKSTYTARILLEGAPSLSGGERFCVFIARKSSPPEDFSPCRAPVALTDAPYTAVFGLRLLKHGSAYTAKPIFARLDRSAAQTRCDKPVSASLALSVKAPVARTAKSGLEIEAIDAAALTFSKIPLKATETAPHCSSKHRDGCPGETDIFVIQDSNPVSLTLAVTEVGSDAAETDEIEAEIDAIAAAVGSAFGGVLKVVQPSGQ